MESPLDDPIWHSLSLRHQGLAIAHGRARRYPPEVAPFAALETREVQDDALAIVEPGEAVGFLGVRPEVGAVWEVVREFNCVQMVWEGPAPESSASGIVPLGETDLPDMLELTALVYPHYFRPGTARLGDYPGVREGGRLAAMAGVRMALDGWQEISAVCTHPDFRGRGLAAALTLRLVGRIMAQVDRAFLHTEEDNAPARGLYGKLGFAERRLIPFQVLERRTSEED